jgi:hypothetical protein
VLKTLPRNIPPKAKADRPEIWPAAIKPFGHCLTKYGAKYDRACVILNKDRDA